MSSYSVMTDDINFPLQALEVNPDQVHFKFNVAFVQFTIAQLVHTLQESQRTLAEVEAAAAGLDEAIESFSAIARSPNPPFPKNDIEQRASMGRNTMRKQLERDVQAQRDYEEKNATKLQKARELREAEFRQREEEKKKAEEAAAERRRKIIEAQELQRERDREIMERRNLEEQRRKEFVEEEEHRKAERGSRRKGGKRKKKADDSDSESDVGSTPRGRKSQSARLSTPGTGDERPRQKKRKLERKSKNASKFKSDELIVDSSSEGEAEIPVAGERRKTARVIDDEDEEDAASAAGDVPMAGTDDDEE